MKKFSVPCNFAGGQQVNIDVYIGEPQSDKHPLQNQASWLSKERGGTIPQKVMDGFRDLYEISKRSETSFEDLCMYAIGEASNTNNDNNK